MSNSNIPELTYLLSEVERKYNRRFVDYKIYFSDGSLDDGAQGIVGISDAINAGVDLFEGLFE